MGEVMDLENIWKTFLDKIKEEISPMLYETWFMETKLAELNNETAKVIVPMHIHKKHLKENYNELIVETFALVTGSNFQFEYYTDDEIEKNVQVNDDEIGVPSINMMENNLKPQYTFENFIVGESNKFARTVALAVAEKPGIMYNPLFIYGKSGLGKTHLMHAIGNYIVKNSKKRVLYVTSEQFVNDFIDLYRKNKDNDNINDVKYFKTKYRDITTNVFPPDFELRMHIIDKKIEGNDMVKYFPIEVKEYIASNCTSDIRKLEGAITRVAAFSTMMNGSSITIELAIEALKDYFAKTIISKNKIDLVQQLVADTYNITIDDLKSKKRNANIAVPRQVAMYICRVVCEESFPKIGMEFGGKDHTTVMHSVDKIKKAIKKDSNLELIIKKIESQLK